MLAGLDEMTNVERQLSLKYCDVLSPAEHDVTFWAKGLLMYNSVFMEAKNIALHFGLKGFKYTLPYPWNQKANLFLKF